MIDLFLFSHNFVNYSSNSFLHLFLISLCLDHTLIQCLIIGPSIIYDKNQSNQLLAPKKTYNNQEYIPRNTWLIVDWLSSCDVPSDICMCQYSSSKMNMFWRAPFVAFDQFQKNLLNFLLDARNRNEWIGTKLERSRIKIRYHGFHGDTINTEHWTSASREVQEVLR